jgi:hypothetical protein
MRRSGVGCLGLVLLLATACRPAPSVSPTASVDALIRAVQANDGQALWDHLPRSMKAELAGLLQDLRGQMDPSLASVADRFVAEAAQVLSRQRPKLSEFAPLREGMQPGSDRLAFTDGLVGTLQRLGASSLGQTAQAQTIVDRAGPPLLTMLLPALRAARPDLLEFQRTIDGKAVPEALVLVDGRWIPQRWQLAWRQVLTRSQPLRQGGPGCPLRSNVVQVIRLLNQTRARLAKLDQAGDQAAFDRALSLVAGSLSLSLKWAITPAPS